VYRSRLRVERSRADWCIHPISFHFIQNMTMMGRKLKIRQQFQSVTLAECSPEKLRRWFNSVPGDHVFNSYNNRAGQSEIPRGQLYSWRPSKVLTFGSVLNLESNARVEHRSTAIHPGLRTSSNASLNR